MTSARFYSFPPYQQMCDLPTTGSVEAWSTGFIKNFAWMDYRDYFDMACDNVIASILYTISELVQNLLAIITIS